VWVLNESLIGRMPLLLPPLSGDRGFRRSSGVAMNDDNVRHFRNAISRETGFAIAMLGYGLVLMIGLLYLLRRSPGNDPVLNGTQFGSG